MGKKFLDEQGVSYLIDKILELLQKKVDKEEGKELSEENFTTLLKNKLEELNNYSLPTASSDTLGGVKIGENLSIDEFGVLSSTAGEDAAQRASQSAVVAGNYAAQAIQAQQAIEHKIWYGTMEEYNNLETVSNSTIYIILHE